MCPTCSGDGVCRDAACLMGGLNAHPPNLSCCRACEGRVAGPTPSSCTSSIKSMGARPPATSLGTGRRNVDHYCRLAVPAKTAMLFVWLGIQVAELQLIYRKDGRLPPHSLRARWQTFLFSNEVRLWPFLSTHVTTYFASGSSTKSQLAGHRVPNPHYRWM